MKKVSLWLALAGLVCISKSFAVSLDDIQFWIGTGSNRAALVIEWSAPEDFTYSTVPAPIAGKSLVWGYRFNGSASATEMFNAIVTADPRLYAVESIHAIYGTSVLGIGFHLGSVTDLGITDGSVTNFFTNGLLTNATVNVDASAPLNLNDLYWGGWFGPNWETWTETNSNGGLTSAPDRGPAAYWTSTDPDYYSTGYHGQWQIGYGVASTTVTNGSWVGLSVAAGPWDFAPSAPYNAHKRAPALPDPNITALVKNLAVARQASQWRVQFTSCTNWNYSLERSTNLQNWITAVTNVAGNSGSLEITDPQPAADQAFYRVRAEQP